MYAVAIRTQPCAEIELQPQHPTTNLTIMKCVTLLPLDDGTGKGYRQDRRQGASLRQTIHFVPLQQHVIHSPHSAPPPQHYLEYLPATPPSTCPGDGKYKP